jgi:hypothetical protein
LIEGRSMFSSGNTQSFNTFTPDQLKLVRDIYLEISHRSWFDDDAAKKQELASYVIKMYQRGLVDPEKLQSLCLVAAKRKFARAPATSREAERV